MATIKNADETIQSLVASEVGYIGSFILSKDREKDFYAMRDTEISPESMHDPMSTSILKTINHIRQEDDPDCSVSNIIFTGFQQGFFTTESLEARNRVEAENELHKILAHYQNFGAKTLKQFRQREIAVQENWRNEQISEEALIKLAKMIERQGGTSVDKVIAFRNYFDEMLGELPLQANTADFDKQQDRLAELPAEMAAMVGQPMKGFPPAWGLSRHVKRIRPGELLVLMGGTGDGKSAMAMQFAEWRWASGDNILVIHMEDKLETILMRQTVRWIGGTLEELEGGDPRGRMKKMADLRERWQKNNGEIIYKYLAGFKPSWVIGQIREVSRELHARGKKLDGIVFDYFTKLDLVSDMKPGMNLASVAAQAVDTFKRLAEKLDCYMLVVSQQTKDANGQTHAEMTTNLEKMAQVVLSIETSVITKEDDEESVRLPNGKEAVINGVGDISVWRKLVVKKVNQGQRGIIWVYLDAPRFRVIERQWAIDVRDGRRLEMEIPVIKPLTEDRLNKLDEYSEYYARGIYQLETPEERKRNHARPTN